MEDLGQEALFSRISYQCDRITPALCGLMFEYDVLRGLRLAGTLSAFFCEMFRCACPGGKRIFLKGLDKPPGTCV